MKAIVQHAYGSPDFVSLEEVPKPSPKDNQVLIKNFASSVNRSDWEGIEGKPLYARLGGGLFNPNNRILGSDVAGIVETVGKDVTRFKPGNEVFGLMMDYSGGFAEYACKSEKALALKPAGITFEQASTIPHSGCIAVAAILDKAKVQPGQRALINGAGGGAGTFAIQLAKLGGAEVTAVDNAEKFDMMRSLGADQVIDYTQQDFTRNGVQYDFILDVIANRSPADYERALAPGGSAYFAGGSMVTLLKMLILGPGIKKRSGKNVKLLVVMPEEKDLLTITGLIEAGKVKTVIDKVYPLSETAEALRYLGAGHAKGKIVITIKQI